MLIQFPVVNPNEIALLRFLMDLYKDVSRKNLQSVALKFAVLTTPAEISQSEFLLLQTRLDSVQEYRKSWNNGSRHDFDNKPYHEKGGQQPGQHGQRPSFGNLNAKTERQH